MRLIFTSGILCAGLFTVSCWKREKPKNDVPIRDPNSGNTTANHANLLPFNSVRIWLLGKDSPILDYPAGYDAQTGKADRDGVFYVPKSAYFVNGSFIGNTTIDTKVDGSILTYPTREGRNLVLTFSPPSETEMPHKDAVEYCKSKGQRLPTIEELLDFCAAGTKKRAGYDNHRCTMTDSWSATLYADSTSDAWYFDGAPGWVFVKSRKDSCVVRCVGR